MLFYIHIVGRCNTSMKSTNGIHFNRRKKENILYDNYKILTHFNPNIIYNHVNI